MEQVKNVAIVRRSSRYERMQRRFRIMLTVAFAAIACAVGIVAFRSRITFPAPVVRYDPTLMARAAAVERVFAVRPDPAQGRLWFATAQGLFEYDTVESSWRRWSETDGLRSPVVFDVCFAATGVWAATEKGLCVRGPDTDTFHLADPADSSETPTVACAGDSQVIAYTRDQGLVAYGRGTPSRPVSIDGLARSHAVTCLKTSGSEVLIGSDMEELFAWNQSTGKQRQYRFDVRANGEAQVLDVAVSGGRVWVATSRDGLWVSVSEDSLAPVADFPAKGAFVLQSEPDGLWAGTPWGLFRYHAREDAWIQIVHPKERTVGDFQIIALHADSSRLWYGAADAGCGWFDKQRCSWLSLRAGLSQPNVAALACGDSAVYAGFGYRGGYIDKISIASMQYEGTLDYNRGVGDPNIQSIRILGPRVVFGGFSSFGYTDQRQVTWRYFIRGKPLQGYDITDMVCGDSAYLLGTVFGVVRYDPRTDAFTPFDSATGDRVTCMYRAGDSLWYGTLGRGVKLLHLGTGAVQASYLTGPRIVGIAPVKERFFVATDLQGCAILDPATGDSAFVAIDPDIAGEDPRAARNEVRCMVLSDSLIWLGTEDAGCFVYDPQRGRWGSFTYYEGLISDQVRSFCDTPRYLFIGCYGGLHRVDKQHPRFREAIFGAPPAS